MSRKMRSVIPIRTKLLKSRVQPNVEKQLIVNQNVQKKYYDRNARNLSILLLGDKVKVLLDTNKTMWSPGTISQILGPRRYQIKMLRGNEIIRNRRYIIRDSPQRHDAPDDFFFDFDDVTTSGHPSRGVSNNMMTHNNVVTRSGRIVRAPDRWGDWL